MNRQDANQPISLKSLAPAFVDEQHRLYVDLISEELAKRPETHNIAVTGAYGTGKSSVLTQVNDQHENDVVRLSLSTLGDASTARADEEPDAGVDSTTNRIQKEIVKQLLYQEHPLRTPASRFRRATKFRWGREAWVVPLGALLIMAALIVTGVAKTLRTVMGSATWQGWTAYAAAFALALAVVWVTRRLTGGRLNVKEVRAGGATVSLADTSESYFDKYLDEIVYLFEVSGRTIVIFEDLDRFGDVHIFEALRSLNTILNGARQLQGRHIRFIYALRDSLFEKLGADDDAGDDAATAEVQRANRTKFFDLVIPIVPFITHENARDLMAQTMKTTPNEISADLIDLVARHLAEMRLILNIRNEFAIFHRKLREGPYKVPGLDDSQLFAIVVYKNVHMSDFEKIPLRRSNLDTLYAWWRELVRQNIDSLIASEQAETRRLESSQRLVERATVLNGKLRAKVRLLTDGMPNKRPAQFLIDGSIVDDAIATPGFWRDLQTGNKELTIRLLPGSGAADVTLTGKSLSQLIDDSQSLDSWAAVDAQETGEKIGRGRRNIDFLRHATWATLSQRMDFTVDPDKYTSASPSGAPLPHADDIRPGSTFADLVEATMSSRLARELVLRGYLTEYFTLQVSQFYGGRISDSALNYVRHHVRPGNPDAQFALTAQDVDAILHEEGDAVLLETGTYNIDIVDRLLATYPKRAAVLISQLVTWGKAERDFLDAYMARGKYRRQLLELMTPTCPQSFTYATSAAPVDEATRSDLVEGALTTWNADTDYQLDDAVHDWLQSRYTDLKVLTAPANIRNAEHAVALIARARVTFASVAALGDDTVEVLRHRPVYEITAENLQRVSGAPNIALDVLRTRDEPQPVYTHVLTQLGTYLDAVAASPTTLHTITDPTLFEQVLSELPDDVPAQVLENIINGAHPDCRIPALANAREAAWPILVTSGRTDATVTNIDAYLTVYGEVDEELAALLVAAGTITPDDGDPEGARTRVAIAVLNATVALPDPVLRADLADATNPERPLQPATITPQPGPVVGLLIERKLLADDAETFASPLVGNWATREAAIVASTGFATFMSPTILPADDLPALLDSPVVPTSIKGAVVAALTTFAPGTTTVARLTRALVNFGAELDYARLMFLRELGAPNHAFVELLVAASISDAELLAVLQSMGGNYALLADYGTPPIVVPGDMAHRRLLERLKSVGIVSSFSKVKHTDDVRAYRRHHPQR